MNGILHSAGFGCDRQVVHTDPSFNEVLKMMDAPKSGGYSILGITTVILGEMTGMVP